MKKQKMRGLEILEKHLLYIDGRFKEFSTEQATHNSTDNAVEKREGKA
jgi:hypothetical protein